MLPILNIDGLAVDVEARLVTDACAIEGNVDVAAALGFVRRPDEHGYAELVRHALRPRQEWRLLCGLDPAVALDHLSSPSTRRMLHSPLRKSPRGSHWPSVPNPSSAATLSSRPSISSVQASASSSPKFFDIS